MDTLAVLDEVKAFFSSQINLVLGRIDSLEKLFNKDVDNLKEQNETFKRYHNEHYAFRDEARPKISTLEEKVKQLEDDNNKTSGVKSGIISAVITGILVFLATYFISKGI